MLIGSVPWSYWTVDDDPTKHVGIETLQLPAGPHRIHYTGNEHFTADKTVTLDVTSDLKHSERLGP